MADRDQNVTELLAAWGRGETGAADRLMPVVYDELYRIARGRMRREREGHTLATTELVSEAYLRLVDAREVDWRDRVHFYALAAQIMRRILVDHARRRRAAKRDAGLRVTYQEEVGHSADPSTEVLALHEALEALTEVDPRLAQVVELRYFGGLTVEEAAQVLGISEPTVKRDWRMARAWLYERLASRSHT